MDNFTYPKNFIKYLGTGGARFCMVRQMRWTGGIWFSYGGLKGVIDPGPGSLYHMCSASPALDPEPDVANAEARRGVYPNRRVL